MSNATMSKSGDINLDDLLDDLDAIVNTNNSSSQNYVVPRPPNREKSNSQVMITLLSFLENVLMKMYL